MAAQNRQPRSGGQLQLPVKINMAAFAKQKEACLSQVDLSKKGSIDEHITELIKFINAKEDYFTTSSCSGRISVFSEVSCLIYVLNSLKLKKVSE